MIMQTEMTDKECYLQQKYSYLKLKHIKAHMYKAKVVAELFTRGKVSVGFSTSSVSLSNGQNKTVGLFGFAAVRNDADTEYFLGRVLRICHSFEPHRGSKRSVEYIRPVNIEDLSQDIKFIVNVMESDNQIHYKSSNVIVDCPIGNILLSVKLTKVENVYSLNAIDKLSLEQRFNRIWVKIIIRS